MDLRIHHGSAVGAPVAGTLLLCVACLLLVSVATVGSLVFGEFDLPLNVVAHALWQDADSDAAFVVRELRLPRLLTGLLAGGALGMAGAVTQSITRNPIGEPSLLGVTAGAAFAIVACMAFFSLPIATMLACGTAGGILAALLTFGIGMRMRLQPLYLTLIGMSVNLFFAAAITLLLVSSHVEANGIYYWLTGSLAGRTWQHVHLLWPWVAIGLGLGVAFARVLDLLALDDDLLASLGLRVLRWRLLLGLVAVLLTAATVAATGPLAFVGLVAPHIARLCLRGPGGETPHQRLLPLSTLTGAALVCSADLLAKQQEIPVGILCVLLGGPLLVHLIRKQGD